MGSNKEIAKKLVTATAQELGRLLLHKNRSERNKRLARLIVLGRA